MKTVTRYSLVLILSALSFGNAFGAARSFELRYFSGNTAANGETDFKGPTEVFTTEQRVEFLGHYAEAARKFFDDPELKTKVVDEDEVERFLENLKPQPLPQTRRRLSLDKWKYLGYKNGQEIENQTALARWEALDGISVKRGVLHFEKRKQLDWEFPLQSWRSTLHWRARVARRDEAVAIVISERGKIRATTVEFGSDGVLYFYQGDGKKTAVGPYDESRWYRFRVEFDFAAFERKEDVVRFNLYLDDCLVADYVPMERVREEGVGYAQNFTSIAGYNRLTVSGQAGTELDDLWGVGYHLTGRESYPYTVETFLDESYQSKPGVAGWSSLEYSDDEWNEGSFPIIHGSERYAEEDLYLRQVVELDDFEKAYLNIETLDPSGEVWVNGRVVKVVENRHPQRIDITRYLHKHEPNVIGVKVDHFYLTEDVGEIMPHSYLDLNLGWFAGRMTLDLVGRQHIEDVFAYTDSLGQDSARLNLRLTINNGHWLSLRGKAEVHLSPWFPAESPTVVGATSLPVELSVGSHELRHSFEIQKPKLWTPETPHLYKVRVVLRDDQGTPLDDYVTTMGVRTIDQAGGTFRLNGEPFMANGAQIMGYRGPIEKLATWNRSCPDEWVAKELLMVKAMNGNLLRIHAHGWEFPARGINDPRYAEMADQMGMMLLWCPTAWIRTGRGWGDIDFEGFPKYMRQVRHHPSIVIWETANHTQSFKSRDVKESNIYVDHAYNLVYETDPSRLISVNSFIWHLHYANDEGTRDHQGNPITPAEAWTAPMITRGNQDSATGYGRDWSALREYPGDYRKSFLDSRDRAYFNFEHQESIGQPNWNLVKGKPWYRLHSYEWGYDEGSIGRRLALDEWEESQAWQAFSAWEAMKKMRFLDYDGFSWCCLHGGANSVTYKKPLIDFMDHAKLAFWANKMVFQKTVAGSHDVDIVYGPDDLIRPVIIHWGGQRKVKLKVEVKTLDGKLLDERTYSEVDLPSGRSAIPLKPFRPERTWEGFCIVEYSLDH